MKKDKYSFKKLDQETIKDWLSVSLNCSYAWLDVVNTDQVQQKIQNLTSVNLVLYNVNKDPVAIYSSRQITDRKFIFLNIKVLEAHFNGIFIADKFNHLFGEIRNYFLRQLVGYFKTEHKIDVIEHFPPPSLIVTHPELVHHQSLATEMNLSKNDSLVSFELSGVIMENLKSKVRNEVRRGVKSIENNGYILISDKSLILLNDIYHLDQYKSNLLEIEPLDKNHLERIFKDDAYEFYLLKNSDGQPLVITIIEVFCEFSIYHYNSSNLEKDKFINKALLYKIMEKQKQNGRVYFLLGMLDTGNTGLDEFKLSMSNIEHFLFWNYTSLTIKGVLSSLKFIIQQIISLWTKKNVHR
jgi:hypothetical protein